MKDNRSTAIEWFDYFMEIPGSEASRFGRALNLEIAERMQRELPNGTDEERAAWAREFLRQNPRYEKVPQKPADLADYSPQELLEWEATRKPRIPLNPRGIRKPDPKHPSQKRRGEK